MQEKPIKIYPTSSEPVAKMLGIEGGEEIKQEVEEEHTTEEVSPGNLPAAGLTVAPEKSEDQPTKARSQGEEIKSAFFKKAFKSLLPYLIVFLIGLFAYYFFLSNTSFNLSGMAKLAPKEKLAPLTVKDTALMELEKDPENLERYYNWMAQFYFEVSDPAVIEPNADNSGNGLTNFQKFLLGLNPKAFDTLGLGRADSELIAEGINPLTGGPLADAQKSIVEKYFDLEIINNRLAIESLRQARNVAGSSIVTGAGLESARSGNVSIRSGNNNNLNQSNNYNYNLPNSEIMAEDLNTNTAGRLEIPELNINVPIIFSREPKSFEKDLQLGVVHYPGTALPGQIGTTYISGHSSNYAFAPGNYNKVFAKLGDLPDNASFIITVVQKDGKDARFHYVVTHRKEFSPTDQEQFRNAGESVVALSTCWPVGSTKSRLVVFGKLTQIEK